VENEEDSIIEQLILRGALEPSGFDTENGEMLYSFTNKLQTDFPEIHAGFMTFFSQDTMKLWEHGFIEMDVTEDNPVVKLTAKAFDKLKVKQLDESQQWTLKEIIRVITEQ